VKLDCESFFCISQGNRRETRLLNILSFVHSTVWKSLFGKVADSLEKGTEHEDEYMISEKELLVNRFDNFKPCKLGDGFLFLKLLECFLRKLDL
jgi:hypothetical protein